ncbi:MAG: hypothetical protein A3K18_32880 [Lentisphaerae bacterium RIFOXYA12_64_32]|nr:MAG: hypothetical protein A3K18_32880 [Lentisphaerae bacterium RIFOXYA12_64_32]
MTAEQALAAVGGLPALEHVAPYWDESMAAMPSGGVPFLDSEAVRSNREWCGFPAAVDTVLLATAARIRENPALSALIWHCAWRVYDAPEAGSVGKWPLFPQTLGADGGVFYLLVGLSIVPRLRAHHGRLGIPEDVTRETCQQPRCFCGNYDRQHPGALGIPLNQLGWLRHYTREVYLRLGRFEYWLRPFAGAVQVFRHCDTGEVIALAENGARFDRDGYQPRDADPATLAAGWQSVLTLSRGSVTGTPLAPWGKALRQSVTLSRTDWKRILGRGDWILQIHIPAGGAMTRDDVNHSLRRAAEFFASHFPDKPVATIQCTGSWIYNPDLERFLPADANLVLHLRDVYLYPIASGGTDGLWFIFFQDPFDPASAPRDTRLQRAVLDWLGAGNTWRAGGMFVLPEHVRRLGTTSYRDRWPPQGLGL